MSNQLNLKHKFGKGISIGQFMCSMKVRVMEMSQIPNTKEQFIANYENFSWENREDQVFYKELTNHSGFHCLILCTDWCPDVIWNVPVLARVMEEAQIPAEILVMEDHLETMDLFLTDGGRAQPIAVLLDAASGNVLGRWGARPAYIQAIMDQFKENHPEKQAADYQESLNQTYCRIGETYHKGREYQTVMIQELKKLFVPIHS